MTDIVQGGLSPAVATPIDYADMRRRIKAIIIGSIGNLVEWYDFYVYTAFSLYFAPAFFPGSDPVIQQRDAAFFFWAGFVVRPLGGWLFGHLADRFGRRGSLMASVLMMCFGSLMIAALPTYASIGIAAPLLLGLARIIQGISLGGEYGASATYLSEVADPQRRGFYSSFQYVTLIGGQLAAILVLLVLQKLFLTNEEITAWGWRIPFVIGALLAVIAAVMRSQLHETEAFEAAKKTVQKTSSLKALMAHPREVLLVIGLTLGGTCAFYTYTTYMQTFLKLSVGLDSDTTTLVVAGSLIFAIILQPIYGYVSDHIGRRPVLTWFGVCGVVFTYALLTGIQATKNAPAAFCMICFAWIIVAGYTSINAIVKAELFPTRIRATGVGLPYALTVSIFGGTAPLIALQLKSMGHESWFYLYLTGCILVSLLVYTLMRDTKLESAMERHE
ncbi:MFS transporter, MHS family, alpha-ketoglutarate permease [Rhizobiales bacterium GAS191]|jgi:MHS family alpha-ketoglutarate permease-like MFS transporter|nr:MFS transporter, MHS family, alpha-ketoglutarate permease [Rhizobiales bacterium GAS191]